MIESIKELRARTNLGMTACKKALEQAGGDIDAAIEILQKQGLKKVDDLIVPLEGAVQSTVSLQAMFGQEIPEEAYLVELNCQTDFAARSELFKNALFDLRQPVSEEEKNEKLKELSKQLGEKVVVRRFHQMTMSQQSGFFTHYNHQGGNIAVALPVFTEVPPGPERLRIFDFTNEVAMHIAATKPLGVRRESIDVQLVQKKRAFFEEEAKDKKPEMQAKIVEGKMNKWYAEVVLMEQESVVHPKKTISSLVEELKKEVGEFSFGNFVRWERGEQL